MDYLEAINDPLKHYFKEKIGNLYINKDVMKIFIEKGNKGEGQSVLLLTDSFLKFSEIQDLEQTKVNKEPIRLIDRMSFKKKMKEKPISAFEAYEKTKAKKKLDAHMIDKVNDEMVKNKNVSYVATDIGKFIDNDQIVKLNLDLQVSTFNSKLFTRRQKSFIKG